MSEVGDVFRIPQFLQARTREDLVRAMLVNNISHGMEFDYFDIQKDGKLFIAWFRQPLSFEQKQRFIVEKITNGQS